MRSFLHCCRVACLSLLCAGAGQSPPGPAGPSKVEAQASYILGYRHIHGLLTTEAILDSDAYIQGVRDAFQGNSARFSLQEAERILETFQGELIRRKRAARLLAAQTQEKAGEAFLRDNGNRQGVQVLQSGLQYEVIERGQGPRPGAKSRVVVHYEGRLIDGTVFDSSRKRGHPATFRVGEVIKGWQQALTRMSVGSRWRIYIPARLAYGNQGTGSIVKPGSALVFDLDLLEILDE